jgi:hydroxymethylpyrimidine/phosphomethylpyrimidine kinase
MTCVAMTIAGSDPSGGAGLQADLKTFHQFGVYGTSVVTLLTVQNTISVDDVRQLDPDFVVAQLHAVLSDIPPHAAKTGALGNGKLTAAVAECARQFSFPLIVDPVMISKHGARLMDEDAIAVLREELLPCAYLVTPNLPEAEVLTDMKVGDVSAMEVAARKIADLGVENVLIKGGHLPHQAVDVLWSGGRLHHVEAERVESRNTHGTGCVYSAAITAQVASGNSLLDSVHQAKRFITEAIKTSPGLGKGCGPVNLHVS